MHSNKGGGPVRSTRHSRACMAWFGVRWHGSQPVLAMATAVISQPRSSRAGPGSGGVVMHSWLLVKPGSAKQKPELRAGGGGCNNGRLKMVRRARDLAAWGGRVNGRRRVSRYEYSKRNSGQVQREIGPDRRGPLQILSGPLRPSQDGKVHAPDPAKLLLSSDGVDEVSGTWFSLCICSLHSKYSAFQYSAKSPTQTPTGSQALRRSEPCRGGTCSPMTPDLDSETGSKSLPCGCSESDMKCDSCD
ncbi:hypothetical protein B0J13DRAFT_15334 [Dactylonectria estremocensis]|uniref:Uncharacterized protein n=1 Tax=Dactylonectria estremocensis TaxID=1079267 RepID=A0A9P9FIY8_9HYPO|nr:hypothetical protein B0J13DRAFT_15334 [Dactylonectria estremocensis]